MIYNYMFHDFSLGPATQCRVYFPNKRSGTLHSALSRPKDGTPPGTAMLKGGMGSLIFRNTHLVCQSLGHIRYYHGICPI